VQRGQLVCPEANGIAREALKELPNSGDALELINKAERGIWFGELFYPTIDNPIIKIQFRRGIFQFMKMLIKKENAAFWMTVLNDNVDFGKE